MKESAKRREGFTVVKCYSVKVLLRSKVAALHSGKAAQWCSGSAIKCYCDKVRQGRVDDVGHVWAYACA